MQNTLRERFYDAFPSLNISSVEWLKNEDSIASNALLSFIEKEIEEAKKETVATCQRLVPQFKYSYSINWNEIIPDDESIFEQYNFAINDTLKAISDHFNSTK